MTCLHVLGMLFSSVLGTCKNMILYVVHVLLRSGEGVEALMLGMALQF